MADVRVLIVEDEYITSTALKGDLEDMGYITLGVATTEKEAFKLAKDEAPNIILMDIELKEGDSGIKAAGKIKEELDIPVIYLTAHSSPDLLRQAKVTTPFGYIVKPYTKKELNANIEMALYKHKLDLELKEARARIKTLGGLIPICASCKSIRDDKGYWNQIEAYIRDHSEVEFTHGICPKCTKKLEDELKELEGRTDE